MGKRTGKPHARKGRVFWERHINDWQGSGLSQTEYCRKHALSPHSFSYWKYRAGSEESKPSAQFVELPTGAWSDVGSHPLFEFRLDEDLRVSINFKLSSGIIRDMFTGRG